MTGALPSADAVQFRNSKPRYALLLLLALGFVAGAIALLLHDARLHAQLAAWACLLFFGACALVFARQLFDPRPRLVLDAAGVTDRTLGIGTIPWREIVDARLHRAGRQPFIGLALRNEGQWLDRLGPWQRRIARANRGAGFDAFNLNLSGLRADPDAVLAQVRSHLAPATDAAGTANAEVVHADVAEASAEARPAPPAVQRAAARMRAGGVVAYPTEAVWVDVSTKPLIGLVWLGTLLYSLGGFIAYRRRAKELGILEAEADAPGPKSARRRNAAA